MNSIIVKNKNEYKIVIYCLILFIYLPLYVHGISDCNVISNVRHQISAGDFKVTRYDKKYVMCAAYYCSRLPTVLPLQLLVHGINSTKDNLAVYLEKNTVRFSNRCGYCMPDQKNCTCRELEPAKGIEIHVRLDKNSTFDESSEDCIWDINFNMSIQEFTCPTGVGVSIPTDNQCNVSVASISEHMCIIPTCSENITHTESQNFLHKFMPSSTPEFCLWTVEVEPAESLTISFSQAIRKYLFLFEESLLNPKWNLRACTSFTDQIIISPVSTHLYILYKNNELLPEESFLQVNATHGCSLPSTIENGIVEFVTSDNGTVARYSCSQNFYLDGVQQINCNSKTISPPVCISEKDKLVSDEPEASRNNISLIELDLVPVETTIIPRVNDVPLSPLLEGSGNRAAEEDGFIDTNEYDAERDMVGNATFSLNNDTNSSVPAVTPWDSNEEDVVLFSLPSLQDKLLLFVIAGAGLLLITVITVVSLIVCRSRTNVRSGLNRKFDTFQNPIYEKPVVRVPLPSTEFDPSQEKIDLGDLSDSTVLD